ncbi:cache domain-containing protein [Methylobacter sp. BlB1]|uniref:cache domain-containing protein n=1 Tax=Methylobacter sp. BlB1 TaxID=2785914 RepID=UPI001894D975|nr:cache domain-containing protein [Methylobacter sp. BlB1]MBF6647572.1 cache domain-containing protein [Methylobacter sp. BlB1]
MLTHSEQSYEYEETRELVALVNDAAESVRSKGEAAFSDFRVSGSRWRREETYVFVLDPEGNMLVHPDPELEGRNVLELKDINGKPIIQGLIDAATAVPDKPEGWYHYQWPVPGGLLPRWKSTYARLATAPSGKRYIISSGMYNDRMEKSFAVDAVQNAAEQIERHGAAAFKLFHDPAGPFIAKDEYIFVFDRNGVNLALPPFPNLEGRSFLDWKDTQGRQFIREMLEIVRTQGSGWVDYMWPKPGESIATQKSAYVTKAQIGDQWVMVGSGVYLADAPKAAPVKAMTAAELMELVREGAAVFEMQGEQAYPEFRKQGSKWLHDDIYFFAWAMDGTQVFHAANPEGEGENMHGVKDILGRPVGWMIFNAVSNPSGEGWIHYMHPKPRNIFPIWKSTFLKRVNFPSGTPHIIGCGIYNMQMDKAFIEDVVNRAAILISEQGQEAFGQLRDKTGPFVFMNTYVFVVAPDGTELVNPAFPSLEGRNLINLRDLKEHAVIEEGIAAAMKEGSVWMDIHWYKPGQNTPARKLTFVRKVQSGADVYIVGSGLYPEE